MNVIVREPKITEPMWNLSKVKRLFLKLCLTYKIQKVLAAIQIYCPIWYRIRLVQK